jgi:hypothetical protein
LPDRLDPFDDGLGPDPLDLEGGKQMNGDGGGGSLLDPSYEDALRIMGRAHEIPSPFEQRALVMDDPEAAELARRLTALRSAAGAGPDLGLPPPSAGPPACPATPRQAVESLVAALQEVPADPQRLAALVQQIGQASAEEREALDRVLAHPAVQAKLG